MKITNRQPACQNEASSLAWHACSTEEILVALSTRPEGLRSAEVAQRLQRHGPNRLQMATGPGFWRNLARQINNLLIYVLLAAAGITAAIGHWLDAGVIVAVVSLNVFVGLLQEGKAEKALQAIRKLLAPHAVVLRDGHQQEIDAVDLVPGDIVLLASGDSVPADVRLMQVHHLRIDEAALTGESVPVDKSGRPVPRDAALGDRMCMGYAGTLVTQGSARAVVVATGTQTEMGRIGRLLESVEQTTTPLVRDMTIMSRWITLAILVVAAALFFYGIGLHHMPAAEMFMASVGLAVAAIPEGLPAIMTVTLAIGVQRMAARQAVVRRLPAVETLGSVTVICSDKTGTLTRNEMTVQEVVLAGQTITVEGVGYAPEGALKHDGRPLRSGHLHEESPALFELAHVAALCNDAGLKEENGHWQLTGDPTEGALLTLAMKAGIHHAEVSRHRPRHGAIPFESDYRYMATAHVARAGQDAGHEILLKGAPERVLEMCSTQRMPDGSAVQLDLSFWRNAIETQARAGRRVLALAHRVLEDRIERLDHEHVADGLTLLGIVGIIDPPRDEAIKAVAQCRAAGIRVKMITGDHGVTAGAIATQLGMGQHLHTLTGPELEGMDEGALRAAVKDIDVFARASPEHKLHLVRALQANGEIVAMTGDGVNDAPALKQADVGVAMGRKGTEAAKQAGEIVLTDDNFASIAHAVEEGRTVYDNLRKTLTFLLPINGGESLSVAVAVILGVALPILPVQILWVNMVSSVGLAMVLAFEPTEPDIMRRPPRSRGEPLLSSFVLWRIAFVSSLFLTGIFGMYSWALAQGVTVEVARTLAVNTLVAMEVFYLFSVRYLKARSFTWRGVQGTPKVLMAVTGVVALQLAFTYMPFMQQWFGTRPLSLAQLVLAALAGAAVLVVLEIEKWLLRRWTHH